MSADPRGRRSRANRCASSAPPPARSSAVTAGIAARSPPVGEATPRGTAQRFCCRIRSRAPSDRERRRAWRCGRERAFRLPLSRATDRSSAFSRRRGRRATLMDFRNREAMRPAPARDVAGEITQHHFVLEPILRPTARQRGHPSHGVLARRPEHEGRYARDMPRRREVDAQFGHRLKPVELGTGKTLPVPPASESISSSAVWQARGAEPSSPADRDHERRPAASARGIPALPGRAAACRRRFVPGSG